MEEENSIVVGEIDNNYLILEECKEFGINIIDINPQKENPRKVVVKIHRKKNLDL